MARYNHSSGPTLTGWLVDKELVISPTVAEYPQLVVLVCGVDFNGTTSHAVGPLGSSAEASWHLILRCIWCPGAVWWGRYYRASHATCRDVVLFAFWRYAGCLHSKNGNQHCAKPKLSEHPTQDQSSIVGHLGYRVLDRFCC